MYEKEYEVLICPFTKFIVYEKKDIEDKKYLKLRAINDDIFISSIFTNLFKINRENNQICHYEKLIIYYENSISFNNSDEMIRIDLYKNLGNINYLLAK